RTWCPACLSAAYSAGVRMAATDPVTPSKTLAIAPLRVQALHFRDQARRQFTTRDLDVAPIQGTQHGPLGCPAERIGDHQVGGGVLPRALGDLDQFGVADADFELEFDEHATEAPVLAHPVDELGRADEPHP